MRNTLLISLLFMVSTATIAQVTTTANVSMNIERIGKTKVEKFNNLNAKGAAMVQAIRPTAAALTSSDNALLTQVAMGGMKQLALSQVVVAKTTNPQVKLLAQSEVEEQTTLSAKLKEIAMAKGITLPNVPGAITEALITQANSLSGRDLDALYLAEGGVKGHQELEMTMTTVRKTAGDQSLKALAMATLPVIKLHLKTSQEVQSGMGGSGTSAGR